MKLVQVTQNKIKNSRHILNLKEIWILTFNKKNQTNFVKLMLRHLTIVPELL